MKSKRAQELASRLDKLTPTLGKSSLVAVTKYSPVEDIQYAYEWGQKDFGENRVQDLEKKAQAFQEKNLEPRWHFIGKLQSNKINQLFKIPNLFAIHSVDSLKLLEKLYQKESQFEGDSLLFFLQIKTSDEDEKSGFESKEEVYEALSFIEKRNSSKLKFFGLMTMGKMRTNEFEKDATKCFEKLKNLRDDIKNNSAFSLKLSMGMSQDYKIAVSLQSDFVRIGSLIFK
ncbi:YggS family pyridoxal phosphate-dependent enzyme [Bacteriovoracales bacterium]|nr:YggS family pyridoxal phosphate-dependent enzyme [Bacteriovoracales bacterium]